MNYKTESGYEVVYPKSVSDICLSSEELKTLFSLNDESVVDDAFEYVSRQLILMKHNKAGINVTVKSAGGSPLEGVPIPNITVNYDGTGEVVTGSDGTAFGYCDSGSVNIAPVNCADVTYTSQSVQTLAGEMYNVEITGTVTNYVEFTSSKSIIFSNNVQNVDVSVGGGGGGGTYGLSLDWGADNRGGGGGGGGYTNSQFGLLINPNSTYGLTVGSGGRGGSNSQDTSNGGTSTFLNVSAQGGNSGYIENQRGMGGTGNGNGGYGAYKYRRVNYDGQYGFNGTQYIFSSFSETKLYGGGGGGAMDTYENTGGHATNKKNGGSPGGGYGGLAGGAGGDTTQDGSNGTNGLGGGGGGAYATPSSVFAGGNGGSGIVCVRMHLKVTS